MLKNEENEQSEERSTDRSDQQSDRPAGPLRLTVDAKDQIIGRLDQLSEHDHDFRKLCEYVFGLLEHPRAEWFDGSGLERALRTANERLTGRLNAAAVGAEPSGAAYDVATDTWQQAPMDVCCQEVLHSLIVWADGIEKWREQVERQLDGMEPRLRSGTGIAAETKQPAGTEVRCPFCSHAQHSGRQCPREETQTAAALPGLTMDVCCRCTGGHQCAFCPHLPHLPTACHQLRSDGIQCQCGRLAAEMQKAERDR